MINIIIVIIIMMMTMIWSRLKLIQMHMLMMMLTMLIVESDSHYEDDYTKRMWVTWGIEKVTYNLPFQQKEKSLNVATTTVKTGRMRVRKDE